MASSFRWPSPLAIAGCASIGAGAIHGAATGTHAEHRILVMLFVWAAAAQIAWGIVALLRSSTIVALTGLTVNLVLAVAWFITRVSGISWIDGLEYRDPVGFADAASAGLAVATVGIALGVLLTPGALAGHRINNIGIPAFAIAALTLPAMVVGGATTHNHSGSSHGHSAAPVPPKPYDGTLPVDLSGVDGVTPEQQQRAEALLTRTIERLPQFADVSTATERGWVSIGDAPSGFEHYINWSMISDDVWLNPDEPESLVYRVDGGGKRTLVSAMYILPPSIGLDAVPDVGGRLTQWHIHNDLCFTSDPNAPRVAGITRPDGACRAPLKKFPPSAMIHVWITAHPCGPFAALEGVGAGQILDGETRWCDTAHGADGSI